MGYYLITDKVCPACRSALAIEAGLQFIKFFDLDGSEQMEIHVCVERQVVIISACDIAASYPFASLVVPGTCCLQQFAA